MNIEFTEDEMGQLRDFAAKESMTMKNMAHDAVMEALATREVLAAGLAVANDPGHAELLRRLADQ